MIWAYWGKNCRFPPNNWIIVTPISNWVLASPCHKIAAGEKKNRLEKCTIRFTTDIAALAH